MNPDSQEDNKDNNNKWTMTMADGNMYIWYWYL